MQKWPEIHLFCTGEIIKQCVVRVIDCRCH